MENNSKIAVTGATGFVASALCAKLTSQGLPVVAISRNPNQALKKINLETVNTDLSRDPAKLMADFKGCHTVFHVASKVDMWGPYQDFYQANVTGTQNVIEACRKAEVRNLIFTSSPSVVADGNNLRNIDESYPIPEKHHANYPATKALAEKLVLAANSEKLRTLALRPHLIFGPGDRHFVPNIVDRARKGRLKIIGGGNNLVDFCFIEDCVSAHIAAMKAMESGKDCCGRAYFISQGQPFGLWTFINTMLEIHGLPALKQKVPKELAIKLASAFEVVAKISPIEIKPLLTKFLVSEMTTDHYFNISAARELLGFNPAYSMEEAIASYANSVNTKT